MTNEELEEIEREVQTDSPVVHELMGRKIVPLLCKEIRRLRAAMDTIQAICITHEYCEDVPHKDTYRIDLICGQVRSGTWKPK